MKSNAYRIEDNVYPNDFACNASAFS